MWQLLLGIGIIFIVFKAIRGYWRIRTYFADKPIPSIPPKPFLLDGSGASKTLHARCEELYQYYPNAKMMGFYNITPIYMFRDPDLIKQITVKEFDHFADHRSALGSTNPDRPTRNIFGNALISLQGQRWRDMRSTLTPAFTGAKMRGMLDWMVNCSDKMVSSILKQGQSEQTSAVLEMQDLFTRFTTDVIATTAFGIEVDSFKDRDNEFFEKGKKMTNLSRTFVFLKFFAYALFPNLMDWLGVEVWESDLVLYFKTFVRSNLRSRHEHGIVRKDVIQLLIEANKDAYKESMGRVRSWSEDEIIAQCFVFFLAGLEPVATSCTMLCYELALNEAVQNQLSDEIEQMQKSLNDASITYEKLKDMKYLDMVVSETLRKWPTSAITDRMCTKNTTLIIDEDGTEITFKTGDNIWIPIMGLHRDPTLFPEPVTFNPERFNTENRDSIHPYSFLPFGVGPRSCIGIRFAMMEIKCIIFHLVKSFTIHKCEKTEEPLQFKVPSIGLQTLNGVWLELRKRN